MPTTPLLLIRESPPPLELCRNSNTFLCPALPHPNVPSAVPMATPPKESPLFFRLKIRFFPFPFPTTHQIKRPTPRFPLMIGSQFIFRLFCHCWKFSLFPRVSFFFFIQVPKIPSSLLPPSFGAGYFLPHHPTCKLFFLLFRFFFSQ